MPLILTVLTMYPAIVEAISELFICASCSFFTDFFSDGCTIELQSNQYKFVFNMSRQNSQKSALLECFSVPQPGVYSVSMYGVWFGEVKSRYLILPNITVEEREGIIFVLICKLFIVYISYHTHSLQSRHLVMLLLKHQLTIQDMEYVQRVCLLITPEVLAVL